MRRREFIRLIGACAVTYPLAAQSQQSTLLVGFLNSGSAESSLGTRAAFREGLSLAGYVEGQNVIVEHHWAEGEYARLPGFAADFVRRGVGVIFAGGPPAALAAKHATSTVPIVFTSGEDPIAAGLVTSLNRPGGNITGVSLLSSVLEAKRLGVLRELLPDGATIAVMLNPNYPGAPSQTKNVREAAGLLGQRVLLLHAATPAEIDSAFAKIVQDRIAALLVCADPFISGRRQQVVLLAARHGIPAIYERREFPEAGGLMSYGISVADGYRQAGIYAGRILKGESPSNLPVVQSALFELTVNLITAKALGVIIPPTLIARADAVIE